MDGHAQKAVVAEALELGNDAAIFHFALADADLELARPALRDGYVGVMITGVAEVVEKNDGKMPPG